MKIKLDENLPESLLTALAELGHDVDNVRKEHLVGQDDKTVWKASQEADRFFTPKTSIFQTFVFLPPGPTKALCLSGYALQGDWDLRNELRKCLKAKTPLSGKDVLSSLLI